MVPLVAGAAVTVDREVDRVALLVRKLRVELAGEREALRLVQFRRQCDLVLPRDPGVLGLLGDLGSIPDCLPVPGPVDVAPGRLLRGRLV